MSREILAHVDGIFFPGSPVERRAGAIRGTAERARDAARPASRRDHAVADPARGGERRAGARRVPRIPGNERRDGRHAAPARARDRRASTTIARTRSSRSTCSTRRRTTCCSSQAACCASSRARSASSVNSLHWQGVDRLAPDLAVEARATGRPGRGVSREVGAEFRARGAVAPRVAGDEQSVFAGAVRRVRPRGARQNTSKESS